MPKRKGRKSAAQTPAPKSDRIVGSKINPKSSASSDKSAKNITFSSKTIEALKDKLQKFKKENPNNKKVNINDLKAVFRRGAGAYSKSHRPTITGGAPNTRTAWAMARVNKFLKKAGGEKVKAAYVQDDDLMAKGGIVKYKNEGAYADVSKVNQDEWYLNMIEATIEGKGYAKKLMHKIISDAKKNKIKKISLHASLNNKEYFEYGYGFNEISFDEDNGLYYMELEIKNFQDDDLMALGGLVAPNGKPSNLNPEQYRLVRTPEFKAWFGDWENDPANASKVVDENGEPKVMWHFAKRLKQYSDKFYQFKTNKQIGSHFGTLRQAQNLKYVPQNQIQAILPTDDTSDFRYYQVFLNIKNPLRLKDVGVFESTYLTNKLMITDEDYEFMKNRMEKSYYDRAKELAFLKGYDGVVYLNRYESDAPITEIHFLDDASDNVFKRKIPSAEDSLIAFYPNQIKLADGSNTTFDGSNPDIRYGNGGEIKKLTSKQYTKLKKIEDSAKIYVIKMKSWNPDSKTLTKKRRDWKKLAEDFGILGRDGETVRYTTEDGIDYSHGYNFGDSISKYGSILKNGGINGSNPDIRYAGGGGLPAKGDCYYAAGQFVMGVFSPKNIDYIGTPYLVHAEVQGQGELSHIRYGHAWIEDDVMVYDFSNGREIVIPKAIYYKVGDIKTQNPKKYHKYTFAEARSKMVKTGHYGCWDIETDYEKGGMTDEAQKETYKKWRSLVNMSKSELKSFYNSEEGKEAGLSAQEAANQGIDSGRESARWILKMKDTYYKEWTPDMWRWAKKQISFISRMRGNRGGLYDGKGNKTRKHLSLLIWGHNPKKK